MENTDPGNPFNIGPRLGQEVFYGWFILATLSLNISKYGLFGVEASMLMEARWAAKNTIQLLIHCDNTWSGLGGWLKVGKKIIMLWRKRRVQIQMPSTLWVILASVSWVTFIVVPISRLYMEVGDGFIWTSGNPIAVGRDYLTFSQRFPEDIISNTHTYWHLGIPPQLPGAGAIYTDKASNIRRKNYEFLQKTPSALPTDLGVPEIYPRPQTDTPVTGKHGVSSYATIARSSITCRNLQFSEIL